MMEFFLSKVWAFVVGMAIMGILVQGVQMNAEAERSSALQDIAENLQRYLVSIDAAGPGLERSVELRDILPERVVLGVRAGYAFLEDGEKVTIEVPVNRTCVESMDGSFEEVECLQLGSGSIVKIFTTDGGVTMVALNPRTSPPGI